MVAKFGVPPTSIADYLALVGDAADGFPGLPGWGAKSAAAVLAKFGSIEAIPTSSGDWGLGGLRGAEKLAVTLRDNLALAVLFRRIATIETDVAVGNRRRVALDGAPAGTGRGGCPHRCARAGRSCRDLARRTR